MEATTAAKDSAGDDVEESDRVELPPQTHSEIALTLRQYEDDRRDVVEQLFRAVWPNRDPEVLTWSDLITETASNMRSDVCDAFTQRGIHAAIEVAERED